MKKHNYHFIGIGGIGMSGLARIALQKGEHVSGSDIRKSPVTEELQKAGASIFIGHLESNVPDECEIVYSTDISSDNPEMMRAKEKHFPLLHRSNFLARLMEGTFPLLVTGTHGKTTTSSLLSHMLFVLGEDPSYSIGGIVESLQSNGGWGKGKWFVAEADESDCSFSAYLPYGAIVTNIGIDHLNHWNSEENLLKGFHSFYEKIQNKELAFWCKDDTRLSSLNLEGPSYGFSEGADFQITKASYQGWKSVFTLKSGDLTWEDFEIPMIGAHSVLNATAVIALCLKLGFDSLQVREALKLFKGVKRRVEKKGEFDGITLYDDYGHHPTEITATLKALKTASPGRRVVVAFQPHRYSRTRDCFGEFAPALETADLVILTDIYSAGESPIDGISSLSLSETFEKKDKSCYVPKQDLLKKLLEVLKPGDVFVSMGAGDITQIGPQLLERLTSL